MLLEVSGFATVLGAKVEWGDNLSPGDDEEQSSLDSDSGYGDTNEDGEDAIDANLPSQQA